MGAGQSLVQSGALVQSSFVERTVGRNSRGRRATFGSRLMQLGSKLSDVLQRQRIWFLGRIHVRSIAKRTGFDIQTNPFSRIGVCPTWFLLPESQKPKGFLRKQGVDPVLMLN
jgi:hypothetical protein